MPFKNLGGGVYSDSRTGNFYERPTINGRRTWRKLDAITLRVARELARAHSVDHARSKAGLTRSPYAPKPLTVGELADAYMSAGCPDNRHRPRSGRQLDCEKSRLKFLIPFWGGKPAESLRTSDCVAYAGRRRGEMRGGRDGGRAVDLELTTLAGILRWAVTVGKLEQNPLKTRPRFRNREITHCRESMPKDAEELFSLANHFFDNPRSEVLGFQLLLESMTGCRTSEVLRLRWDATPGRAGFIDGDHLWLERSKSGCNPFVLIHPALREVINALRLWRGERFPKSPWWLPSCNDGGVEHVASCSLTHALRTVGPILCGGRRTSHGLRAYYVTVRRSQGISDGQIAAEIGDSSGPSIISSTYGAIPPNWRGQAGIGWGFAGDKWYTRWYTGGK